MILTGLWQWSTSSDTSTDPGARHLRADSIAAPTQLAVSTTDDDGADRRAELLAVAAGDRIALRSTETSDAWGASEVTGPPVDMATWVRFPVFHLGSSAVPAPPGNNERILLDVLAPAGPDVVPDYVTASELSAMLGPAASPARVTLAVDAANALIVQWCPQRDGTAAPVGPVTRQAAHELAHELYRAHTAVGGVFSIDDLLARLPADRVRPIRDLLDAETHAWGIA